MQRHQGVVKFTFSYRYIGETEKISRPRALVYIVLWSSVKIVQIMPWDQKGFSFILCYLWKIPKNHMT